VSPGLPEALPGLPAGTKLDRLALARWIVSRNNPLTARVAVNRLWEEVFGLGIVETSEDFGTAGRAALPPRAARLAGHRVHGIGLGRQAPCLRPAGHLGGLPPGLAGQPRAGPARPAQPAAGRAGRASACRARGCATRPCSPAGCSATRCSGPPCNRPQPSSGCRRRSAPAPTGPPARGRTPTGAGCTPAGGATRPYPSLTTFDAPERTFCTVRRVRTNTPLQALVTLNDPVYVEAAQGLARRILAEGGASTPLARDLRLPHLSDAPAHRGGGPPAGAALRVGRARAK